MPAVSHAHRQLVPLQGGREPRVLHGHPSSSVDRPTHRGMREVSCLVIGRAHHGKGLVQALLDVIEGLGDLGFVIGGRARPAPAPERPRPREGRHDLEGKDQRSTVAPSFSCLVRCMQTPNTSRLCVPVVRGRQRAGGSSRRQVPSCPSQGTAVPWWTFASGLQWKSWLF